MRGWLFIAALALSGCTGIYQAIERHQQPIPVQAPEHAERARHLIHAAYKSVYPRTTYVDVKVNWVFAKLIPVPNDKQGRWARGYCVRNENHCQITLIATDSISDGPLAHELLHCFLPASLEDHEWTEQDKDLEWWAVQLLKSQGL